MTRLSVIALVLALAASAQAMPQRPIQQQDNTVITVRNVCGAGMHRVAGRLRVERRRSPRPPRRPQVRQGATC